MKPENLMDLRRANFEGSIPVAIELSQSDQVTFSEQTQMLYLQIPRFAYILTYTDKIFKYFERYGLCSASSKRQIWFSDKSSNAIIKHNHPIGVSYDLFVLLPDAELCETIFKSPLWNIVVHFQNFPLDELVQQCSPDLVELGYMYSLKEADAIIHNSTIIQNMSKRDHKTLWTGLCEGDFNKFYNVNKNLLDGPISGIPFRLHSRSVETSPFQRLIPARLYSQEDATHRECSLVDILELYDIYIEPSDSQGPIVLLNGIKVKPSSPLVWLLQNLAFADNFLHFVIQ